MEDFDPEHWENLRQASYKYQKILERAGFRTEVDDPINDGKLPGHSHDALLPGLYSGYFAETYTRCIQSFNPGSNANFQTFFWESCKNTFIDLLRKLKRERALRDQHLQEQEDLSPARIRCIDELRGSGVYINFVGPSCQWPRIKRIRRKDRGKQSSRSSSSRLTGFFTIWFMYLVVAIFEAKAVALGNPRKDVREALERGSMNLIEYLCEITPKQALERRRRQQEAEQDQFFRDMYHALDDGQEDEFSSYIPEGFSIL
jgi:hypothetical protein